MKVDPYYKSLVDKHGNRKGGDGIDLMEEHESNPEVISEEQVQEAIAHVKKAILVIQGRMRAEKIKLEQVNRMTNLEAQLNVTMTKMLRDRMEVAEVYSPPRVAAMA